MWAPQPAVLGKHVHCLWPLPGRTHEEFRQWWLQRHSGLIRSLAPARRMLHYVQNHADERWVAEQARRGGAEPLVGFTMSTWESLEAREAADATPEGGTATRAAREDSGHWVDRTRSTLAVTAEYLIFGGRPAPGPDGAVHEHKLVMCVRRSAGVSRAEFADWWLAAHARRVHARAAALRMSRYSQSVTLAGWAERELDRGRPEPYDGFAEAWWPSAEEARAALASDAGREAWAALREEAADFVDPAASPQVVVREYVFVDGPRR